MMSHAHKFLYKTLTLLLALGFLPLNALPVHGQGGITVNDAGATIDFGKTITFHAQVKSAQPITKLTLLFQGANQETTYVENVQPAEDGAVSYAYDAALNLFPPFSQISFWFQATLADGQTYASDKTTFRYEDTRFPWNKTNRANVTIHWYGNDTSALALEMAGAGMLAMKDYFDVSFSDPIDIYIYSNTEDLQTTLTLDGRDWVGGHALPETGVALVAIPPEAYMSEFQTKIPHEVAHVLLYRAIGASYNKQPAWLLEGIASMMEQYPDPEYKRALKLASQQNSLIPFTKLCDTFPPDAGSAYLAYAESQSFVSYIYDSYGRSGVQRLIETYGDGVNCELGATRALGISLSQLDVRWRENVLGENMFGVAARNLTPFVLIMALVLVVPLWGMIDLVRQRRKRRQEEKYAEQPKTK